jgi:hypothetical protein
MTRDVDTLREMHDALDLVFWGEQLHERGVGVIWSRWRRSKSDSIRYGAWDASRNLIEVNPILKHTWVPDHVVLWVLFHEQIHALVANEHDSTFHLAELRYPHLAQTEVWLRENHDKLLAAVPPRKSRPVDEV